MNNNYTINSDIDFINAAFHPVASDFALTTTALTGYDNIDDITKLYPGFYVIGAIPSLGKTTFIHQMCDQLAENGQSSLYFSYEQSTFQMVSKSLSRIMKKYNFDKPMTSLEIRQNSTDERVLKAIELYKPIAVNKKTVDCSFKTTIKDIEDVVNDYINTNNQKPVVVIDYLQIIKSDKPYSNQRSAIDDIVTRLKDLQEKHNLILIVISSFNRQNYMMPIDFESFKETGGIEYTADVLWGLQLEVIHYENFNNVSNLIRKKEIFNKAKKEIPREIEFVCIKNRYGICNYSCYFKYYPQNDYFIPNDDEYFSESDLNNADIYNMLL